MRISAIFRILLFVFFIQAFSGHAAAQTWPGIRDSIYSEKLKEKRIIQVILPKNYKPESGQKFEVLYVLDGEWYMEQVPFIYNFANSSGYVPQSIFVLIPNTYVNGANLRDRDFSPTPVNNDPHLGGADNFHAFLKNELIPYVENKYPANGQKSLIGSSFSGLFAVYAFVKEPQLFQSFIASDPSLNYDNGYVSRLAGEKLPGYTEVSTTLFIAGLNRTFRENGIASMDSVLRVKAPGSIHWKCQPYSNETHYSVQHKAFYDGMRFSHLGYGINAEYHPVNGILLKDKPVKIYVLKENPAVHYTTNGTEPTAESPVLTRDSAITISAPAQFRIKSFSNRPQYDLNTAGYAAGNFNAGEFLSSDVKSKRIEKGLSYQYYEGKWNKIPDFKTLKPIGSGIIDKNFKVNKPVGENSSAYLIQGNIEITEDGYYVFYADSENGSNLYVGGKLLFEFDGTGSTSQSYVIPLKKGLYSLRLELLRKNGAREIQFLVFHTKPGNDNWWESEFLRL